MTETAEKTEIVNGGFYHINDYPPQHHANDAKESINEVLANAFIVGLHGEDLATLENAVEILNDIADN